jgi:predicted ATPase
MRRGLAALRATDAELVRPHFLGMLAEGLGMAGRPDEGLRALEEGLTMSQRNGERYYEAELYRLKGELLFTQSVKQDLSRAATGGGGIVEAEPLPVARAVGCFNQSIKVARQQQAKSLELRAAMSLARLYQSQDKPAEARSLLTRVYGEFTEGFDTLDLREAKELLLQLS